MNRASKMILGVAILSLGAGCSRYDITTIERTIDRAMPTKNEEVRY